MLSFLNHRVLDHQDTQAMEHLADWLAYSIPPPSYSFKTQLPDPPTSIIYSPNLSLAVDYYHQSATLGSVTSAKKVAILLSANQNIESYFDKEWYMQIAVEANDIQAIKILAHWKNVKDEKNNTDMNMSKVEKKGCDHARVKVEQDNECEQESGLKLWIKAALLGDMDAMLYCAHNDTFTSDNNINDDNNNNHSSIHKAETNDGLHVDNDSLHEDETDDNLLDDNTINIHWLRKAAESGNASAIQYYMHLKRQSKDCFTKACLRDTQKYAAMDDIMSLICLGISQDPKESEWNAWNMVKNVNEALNHYFKAYDLGCLGIIVKCIGVLYDVYLDEQLHSKSRLTTEMRKVVSVEIEGRHVRDVFDCVFEMIKDNGLQDRVAYRVGDSTEDLFELFKELEGLW